MKNSGITLITLVVMIAVIIILTSIFMASGLDSLNEAKNTEIKNEIYQLSQAVSNRYTSYEKNDGNIVLHGTLAKNVSDFDDVDKCMDKITSALKFDEDETQEDRQGKINRINSEITRDYEKFVMVIDANDRVKLGMENSTDNIYIVDYFTGSVYGPIE